MGAMDHEGHVCLSCLRFELRLPDGSAREVHLHRMNSYPLHHQIPPPHQIERSLGQIPRSATNASATNARTSVSLPQGGLHLKCRDGSRYTYAKNKQIMWGLHTLADPSVSNAIGSTRSTIFEHSRTSPRCAKKNYIKKLA